VVVTDLIVISDIYSVVVEISPQMNADKDRY